MSYHNDTYGTGELTPEKTESSPTDEPSSTTSAPSTHSPLVPAKTKKFFPFIAVTLTVAMFAASFYTTQTVLAETQPRTNDQRQEVLQIQKALIILENERVENQNNLEIALRDRVSLVAAKQEADRVEAERIEAERIEAERQEAERVEAQRAAQQAQRQTTTSTNTSTSPSAESSPPAQSSGSYGIPPDSYWDRMAICETGGNWAHFPYGTWTGGLGIYNQTWLGWGGGEFAPTAGQATREQQIIVANRIATQGYGNLGPVGYSAWGCLATVGYP